MSATDELLAAIKSRDQAAVTRILAADPGAATAVDADGVSALLTAAYHGNADAVAALRATAIELSIFEAAAVGDLGRVRALVDADPSLARAFAVDGFHPLGLAAFFGHPDVVRFLIAAGADVNVAQQDAFTPLHEAAQNGDRDILEALVAAGADPTAQLSSGERPADLARKHEHPELAPLLERTG